MRVLTIITLTAIILCLLFPHADIFFSSPFFEFNENNIEPHGFANLQWAPWNRTLYLWVNYLTRAYAALLIFAGLYKICCGAWFSWRHWLYLALVLIIGFYGAVELCKHSFDRPRPKEIVEFRGIQNYVPPLHIGKQDGKSFVSGHAAIGFYVAAFAFLARQRRYRIGIYALGIMLGIGIGITRIMAGSHFVSDILFSGLIMLWTIHLLAWIMFPKNRG